ncbi:MAG: hypothetical protein U7M05_06330 [Candidatus Igneacidithiobacillus chanchocoensis]
MGYQEKFSLWASGFSGCDGGDLGSPESPSIWVCGIEWGGELSYDWLKNELDNYCDQSLPSKGYTSEDENTAYRYNVNTVKLLCSIDGSDASNYRDFSIKKRPFVSGSTGYFKMNLYPIRFKGHSTDRWAVWINELTGFSNKMEYHNWCRKNRFKLFRKLTEIHRPKLVLCFGKSYINDFRSAFCSDNEEWLHEPIEHRTLSWVRTKNTVVAVCPFPTSPYGLNSNLLLNSFGKRIREIMKTRYAT